MAHDETQITLPEDESEKLKSSEEADVGPLTPNKPLDEIQITLPEDENEKLKSSEEADLGPLTSNKPLDEIQITITEDEINKLKLLEDTDKDELTINKPLIQKVPQILRSCYSKEDCERYFKPTSVAIGPLNHQKGTNKDSRMERAEECKRKMAVIFMMDGREDFYKNVKKEINSLRSCYNLKEEQKLSDEDLALMFLVDGCALLLFIALDVNDAWEEFSVENDLVSIEKVDFFLLENQLPYKLLEILIDSFSETSRDSSSETSSPELTVSNPKVLFKRFITEFINRSFLSLTGRQQDQNRIDFFQPESPHKQKEEEEDAPQHLLDLLRRRLMEEKGEKQIRINKDGFWEKLNRNKSERFPSIWKVKELKEKGIRFKARERGVAITEIDFKDCFYMATLTLTPIFLHNTTVRLLLNLIAYELCPDCKETRYITSHLSFLDSLIDKEEDVKELRTAGVLHNELGSDEAVAELLNKISDIPVPNPTRHSNLKQDIHNYCNNYKKSHFSRVRASIKARLTHTYFRTPWRFLVFLAALAGLIMTGMQTYYSFQENKLRY